jgi:hypothetical protein
MKFIVEGIFRLKYILCACEILFLSVTSALNLFSATLLAAVGVHLNYISLYHSVHLHDGEYNEREIWQWCTAQIMVSHFL